MNLFAKRLSLVFVLAVVISPSFTRAEEVPDVRHISPERPEIFSRNQTSLQFVTGPMFSPIFIGERTPVFNYWQTNLRFGWMLTNPPSSPTFLRGNFEAILELSNSVICNGFGNYMGGITGLIRYNFVQRDAKLIPYLQAGAGIIYTDAYKDYSQDAIGHAVEFVPQGSLGLRCLISDHFSIDAEAVFQHISNASLAERNAGINALGGFVGITYFFGCIF